jgi:hypothetical protein
MTEWSPCSQRLRSRSGHALSASSASASGWSRKAQSAQGCSPRASASSSHTAPISFLVPLFGRMRGAAAGGSADRRGGSRTTGRYSIHPWLHRAGDHQRRRAANPDARAGDWGHHRAARRAVGPRVRLRARQGASRREGAWRLVACEAAPARGAVSLWWASVRECPARRRPAVLVVIRTSCPISR